MMPENVVYFSGAHGSGKSTLISKLIEGGPEKFALGEEVTIPHSDNPFEREKIRIARYYLQAFSEKRYALQHPDRALLCDRGVLDCFGYMAGFVKLGWATDEEFRELKHLYESMFPPELRPHSVVFCDPPLDVLIRNIKKRWETKEKKWREADFEYLDAVRIGCQEFFRTYEGNVLHIATTDLAERVQQFSEWITQSHQRTLGLQKAPSSSSF